MAYASQRHEMLFDAHARVFAAFGGIARQGIPDYVPSIDMWRGLRRIAAGKAADAQEDT